MINCSENAVATFDKLMLDLFNLKNLQAPFPNKISSLPNYSNNQKYKKILVYYTNERYLELPDDIGNDEELLVVIKSLHGYVALDECHNNNNIYLLAS